MSRDLTDHGIVTWTNILEIARASQRDHPDEIVHVLVSPAQRDYLSASWGPEVSTVTPAPPPGFEELWWNGVLIETAEART